MPTFSESRHMNDVQGQWERSNIINKHFVKMLVENGQLKAPQVMT